MPNLILTNDCQRNCAYCFAQESKNDGEEFTWPAFVQAAEFIATGPKTINLLGGEPTLHPDFVKMLEYLIDNDYYIQVFTNGMLKQEKIDEITDLLNRVVLRKEQLFFAVNINEEKYRTEEESELQNNFLKQMNSISYPSFTIHDRKTNLIFLQDLIDKYILDRTIRLGLAMPIVEGKNKYLKPANYKLVAKNIKYLAENSPGTYLRFDCGFPLCMFDLDDIRDLNMNRENKFRFVCGCPMDIYPNLTIANCYPLSNIHKVKIEDFANVAELYEYFGKGLATPAGIYGETCSSCGFFKTSCLGGCKSHFFLAVTGGDS